MICVSFVGICFVICISTVPVLYFYCACVVFVAYLRAVAGANLLDGGPFVKELQRHNLRPAA